MPLSAHVKVNQFSFGARYRIGCRRELSDAPDRPLLLSPDSRRDTRPLVAENVLAVLPLGIGLARQRTRDGRPGEVLLLPMAPCRAMPLGSWGENYIKALSTHPDLSRLARTLVPVQFYPAAAPM